MIRYPAPALTAPERPTLPTGTILDGRYQVLSVLGRGAMGTVYEVEHLGIGRRLALKVLHDEMGASPSLRERFSREARSTARLEHPSIVQVTDFGRTLDGAPYMVMELVRGRQLSQLRADEVSFDRAMALMLRVLRALEHAHERAVVHRDLKPDNIMLVDREGEDEVKILDFGLAVLLSPEGDPRLTQAGAVFGTPRYMSPEQASGESVDHRSDLYSVAVMLTEVLTGQVLFDGATASEVLAKQITDAPQVTLPPAAGWNSGQLQGVLLKGLKKHPKDRFETARALREALEACRASDAEVPVVAAPLKREPSVQEEAVAIRGGGRSAVPYVLATAVLALAVFALTLLVRGPDVAPLEAALAANDLEQAGEHAERLLAEHPDDAQVRLLIGHVAFARGERADAFDRYGRAFAIDPDLTRDDMFQTNVRGLIGRDDETLERAVQILGLHPSRSSSPLLAHVAQAAKQWPIRREAYESLEKIDDFGPLDRVSYLAEQLTDNSTRICSIRKWYVDRLIALDDRRAVPALEDEAERHRCARKQIEAAVARLGKN